MAQLASTFKSEISRLAKRESRKLVEPVRKSAVAAKHQIAALRRRLDQLERAVAAHGKRAVNGSTPADTADIPRRFRAQGVKAHRDRLGLSAEQFGQLMGVSSQAIYGWEQGKARPKGERLAQLIELRKLGKREAAARLAALGPKKRRQT